jgi:Ca-activated chloride channel family protein
MAMSEEWVSYVVSMETAWERGVVPEQSGIGKETLLVRLKAIDAPPGQRRAPVDVAFVLDRSGSMSGEKLELVKEAVSAAAGLLRDDDRAALVIYDDQVERLQPLAPATSRMKAQLRLALHGVDAGGSTYLSGGWLTGCDELAGAMDANGGQTRIRRALLLTDGLANIGIVDPGELITHAKELRRRGIGTSALGVGEDFDEALLSGMAEAGGGNFAFIERREQFAEFFHEEIGQLLATAASNCTLALTLPAGVRARLVNAYPVERNGKTITVALGDVPAGSEIALIFDVTVAPGQAQDSYAVELMLTGTDVANDRAFDARRTAALRVGTAEEASAAGIDAAVQESAALERASAAKREAMLLDRAGRHRESRMRMRESLAAMAAAPQSARVMEMSASMQILAEADADFALESRLRKQATHDAMRHSRGRHGQPGSR